MANVAEMPPAIAIAADREIAGVRTPAAGRPAGDKPREGGAGTACHH